VFVRNVLVFCGVFFGVGVAFDKDDVSLAADPQNGRKVAAKQRGGRELTLAGGHGRIAGQRAESEGRKNGDKEEDQILGTNSCSSSSRHGKSRK